MKTYTLTIVAAALLVLLPHPVAASEAKVRPYADPGYRRLGTYGGGPFDYYMGKMSVGDTFPNKKQWWEKLKNEYDAKRHRHDIYIVYTGLHRRAKNQNLDPAVYIKRLDAWLKPEPNVPTYPELIPIICFGEENRHFLRPTFDAMARHVRSQYGIAVMQWWEGWFDPLGPDPQLTADAWAFDYYFVEHPDFRPFLMKFVALGKPVICIPWAADPHWKQFHDFQRAWEMINNVEWQFQACMEFNVTTALFAVAGHGSYKTWAGSRTPAMVATRNWIGQKWDEMKLFKEGDLPLPSANVSARRRTIAAGGPPGEPSVYQDDFDGFRWIDDADLTGFLDMQLTSRPQEPGFLLAKTRADRPVEATLTYRFETHFPIRSIEAELVGEAPKAAKAVNELRLSVGDADDLKAPHWPARKMQIGVDGLKPLTLRYDRRGRGEHVFYVQVRMSNDARAEGVAANRLDRLVVKCTYDAPPNAVAKLDQDVYGDVYYQDDFSTARWRELGSLEVSGAGYGGWQQYSDDLESRAIKGFWPARTKQASFWVTSQTGARSKMHLVQRFTSPKALKHLKVMVNNWTDKEKKGLVTVGVSRRGGQILWQTTSKDHEPHPRGGHGGRNYPDDYKKGWAELVVKGHLQAFDVHVMLTSPAAEASSDERAASVFGLKIEGK